jgi:hypothetical protein
MKRIFTWAVALGCGIPSASADGLLGKRHAEVSYLGATWHEENATPSARIDIESGKGFAVSFNAPLMKHLDVGLRFSELKTKYRVTHVADGSSSVSLGSDTTYGLQTGGYIEVFSIVGTRGPVPATDKWRLYELFQTSGSAGDTFVEERSTRERNATLSVTAHSRQSWGTPFASLDAGVAAFEWDLFGTTLKKEYFTYEISAGVEVEMGKNFSLTPTVSFRDVPEYDHHDEFRYGLRAHYWLRPHAGIVVSAVRNDDQDVFYRAGLTVGF